MPVVQPVGGKGRTNFGGFRLRVFAILDPSPEGSFTSIHLLNVAAKCFPSMPNYGGTVRVFMAWQLERLTQPALVM